jgi:hypothetical protein
MKKKTWQTAEQFMAELNSNPEFLRRKAEKDARRREREEHLQALERPILDKLKECGFDAPSIADLVEIYSPLPDVVVGVLLDSLEQCANTKTLESLIRALGAAARPFDGRPLVKCYESFNDDTLRWVIANTIALVRPHSIDAWIAEALSDPVRGVTLRNLGF